MEQNTEVVAEPTVNEDGVEPVDIAPLRDWRDDLPGDLRSGIGDIHSVQDLAKGYVNAQQMIGSSIRIPGKEAGQEDWDKFYSKFEGVPGLTRYDPDNLQTLYQAAGRPESPEKYGVEGASQDFLRAAHAAGLNREQVNALLEFDHQTETAANEAHTQAIDDGINTLKQEWGRAFDGKVQEAQRAVAFLERTAPGLSAALDATGAGDNPVMIRLFQALGANLKETDGFGNSTAKHSGLTPYEAKMQIEDILNNPTHPYHDGDEAATEKFLELHRYAHPD